MNKSERTIKLSNRFWMLMLGVIVIISAIIAVLLWRVPADYARIYHDNVLVDVINLTTVTERREIEITRDNANNVVVIEYGRVRMECANCPDGICVRRGWVSGGLIPIVCLPNRVVIVFDSSDNDVDAVVG
ncbi:MAG: NusG domain II-containing protein [Oscillospiraceae bacterium]|nr:NusG domain II-containing protein [Oscillospiraceae bacterium]